MSELSDSLLSYLKRVEELRKAEEGCAWDAGYFLAREREALKDAEERFIEELTKRLSESMKRDKWRQANPADQIVQICSGIQGHASNLAEGMYSAEKAREVGQKISDWTQELIELTKMLPPTKWPDE